MKQEQITRSEDTDDTGFWKHDLNRWCWTPGDAKAVRWSRERGSSAVRPSWGLLDWLVSLDPCHLLARMAAVNPSTPQKVPPSEGHSLSSWILGVLPGLSLAEPVPPFNATVCAFQPPQVFKEEPSSTNVPNESVKEKPWLQCDCTAFPMGQGLRQTELWLGVDGGPWIKTFARFSKHCWQGIEVIFRGFQYLNRENDILGTGSQDRTKQSSRTAEAV